MKTSLPACFDHRDIIRCTSSPGVISDIGFLRSKQTYKGKETYSSRAVVGVLSLNINIRGYFVPSFLLQFCCPGFNDSHVPFKMLSEDLIISCLFFLKNYLQQKETIEELHNTDDLKNIRLSERSQMMKLHVHLYTIPEQTKLTCSHRNWIRDCFWRFGLGKEWRCWLERETNFLGWEKCSVSWYLSKLIEWYVKIWAFYCN